MKKIGICLIGAGRFAGLMHLPVLSELKRQDDGIELLAVCDPDRLRADKLAEKGGFKRSYSDLEAMLDAEKPDMAAIITPEQFTAGVGAAVLRRGIPALLEKPPGRSPEELQLLIEAANAGNTLAATGFNRRSMPLLLRTAEILEHEFPDEKIEHIRCDFYRHGRGDRDFSATAIHGIDAVGVLAKSRYVEAEFRYQPRSRAGGDIQDIFMYGRFAGGASALLSFCQSTGALFERYTVNTPMLTLVLEAFPPPTGGCDAPGRIWIYRRGELLRVEDGGYVEPGNEIYNALNGGYLREYTGFIERIRRGDTGIEELKKSFDAVVLANAISKHLTHWKAEASE